MMECSCFYISVGCETASEGASTETEKTTVLPIEMEMMRARIAMKWPAAECRLRGDRMKLIKAAGNSAVVQMSRKEVNALKIGVEIMLVDKRNNLQSRSLLLKLQKSLADIRDQILHG